MTIDTTAQIIRLTPISKPSSKLGGIPERRKTEMPPATLSVRPERS